MAFKARKWQTAAFKIVDKCSIDKQNDGILLSIVNNKKLVKEKKFVDKAKLKDALIKLKNKKKDIKIIKI